MPREKVGTVQVRFNVPPAAFDRLKRLSDALSMSVPDLTRVLVSVQLVQWEAMYLHPERFMDAAAKVGGPAAGTLADQMANEAVELAAPDAARNDRPGFRPGGKPRSLLELEVSAVPGSEWSGYLHGL